MCSLLSRSACRPVSRGALGFFQLAGTTSARAASADGTATPTSEHVRRGSAQRDGDPAVQAGLALAADNGGCASPLAASITFAAAAHAGTEFPRSEEK
jgi:hypothetical protein